MKPISEQAVAQALKMWKNGISFDKIAEKICCNPKLARQIVKRAAQALCGPDRCPELVGLSNRAAHALFRLGICTKKDAERFMLSGQGSRHYGIGPVVIREVCGWCGLQLMELSPKGYTVKGQVDREQLIEDLHEQIRLAERSIQT